MSTINEYLTNQLPLLRRVLISLLVFLVLLLLKRLLISMAKRMISDTTRFYYWRRTIVYTHTALLVILIGRMWVSGIDSIAAFLGLASAGPAIAVHDTIASLAGWIFILSRRPFNWLKSSRQPIGRPMNLVWSSAQPMILGVS